jgi:hypothetical protein
MGNALRIIVGHVRIFVLQDVGDVASDEEDGATTWP